MHRMIRGLQQGDGTVWINLDKENRDAYFKSKKELPCCRSPTHGCSA